MHRASRFESGQVRGAIHRGQKGKNMYLSTLSDAEIEERVQRLGPNQRAIYLRQLGEVEKRHALFLALTYPENYESQRKEGG